MLRSIDPPLGFGKKCPERMAYKKLIRMNMPMDKEGKVSSKILERHYPLKGEITWKHLCVYIAVECRYIHISHEHSREMGCISIKNRY